MKRICGLVMLLLIIGLTFSSSVFAASSDNDRVVGAMQTIDGELASITSRFLDENAIQGKTLSSDQADQVIALINEAGPTYRRAVEKHDTSSSTFNSLADYYSRGLAMVDVAGAMSQSKDGVITLKAEDNVTGVTFDYSFVFTTKGISEVTGNDGIDDSQQMNLFEKTHNYNYNIAISIVLMVLLIISMTIILYCRKTLMGFWRCI